MILFSALLIWFFGGGVLAALMQFFLLSVVHKSTRRETPCLKSGFCFSLVRMSLICWLCCSLLDLAATDHILKAIVFADVLATAIHAFYAVRRYGSYARRSGYRTGMNLGSLFFGIAYIVWAIF
ncbi:MAG: hypothetical protein J5846_09470 [Desulfovibrio sp.]|nr:hypothetical protein [Desulfovibrio sp.]